MKIDVDLTYTTGSEKKVGSNSNAMLPYFTLYYH